MWVGRDGELTKDGRRWSGSGLPRAPASPGGFEIRGHGAEFKREHVEVNKSDAARQTASLAQRQPRYARPHPTETLSFRSTFASSLPFFPKPSQDILTCAIERIHESRSGSRTPGESSKMDDWTRSVRLRPQGRSICDKIRFARSE